MIAYIIISIVFILVPLMFFSRKLIQIKHDGLQRLSALGATLSGKFEREWMNDLPIDKRIDENKVDPSMLFDYAGMYDQLQQLRTLPVTLRDIAALALVLFIPFIPILFIHFSVGELLQKIFAILT